jgi:hypothetical protein
MFLNSKNCKEVSGDVKKNYVCKICLVLFCQLHLINKHPDILKRIWFVPVSVTSVENTGSLHSSFCVPENFMACQCVPVITACIIQLSGYSFRTTGEFQAYFVGPLFPENWILLELYKECLLPLPVTAGFFQFMSLLFFHSPVFHFQFNLP